MVTVTSLSIRVPELWTPRESLTGSFLEAISRRPTDKRPGCQTQPVHSSVYGFEVAPS